MCQAVASARMEPVLRLSKKTCNIPIHDTPLHHCIHILPHWLELRFHIRCLLGRF